MEKENLKFDPNNMKARTGAVVLDHILNISYDRVTHPLQNIFSIHDLKEGLLALGFGLRQYEIELKLQNKDTLHSGGWTYIGGMPIPHSGQIVCQFHWYANTLVNYLRLIGFIDITAKKNITLNDYKNEKNNQIRREVKQYCTDYVKTVAPDIYVWRNKVSAHFSMTDPQDDSLSTIVNSVILGLNWNGKSLVMAPTGVVFDGQHPNIPGWSLTEHFESLMERLWPELKEPFTNLSVTD